jgi:hypothetical protein
MNPEEFRMAVEQMEPVEHNPRAVRTVGALLACFWIAVGGIAWLVLS